MGKILNDLVYSKQIPTYVGAPIAQFKDTYDTLERKYFANIEAADNLEVMLSQLDLRDADEDIRKEIAGNISGILSSYRENNDWENAQLAVRRGAKDIATNSGLRAAMASRQKEIKHNQDLDALHKEGKLLDRDVSYALQIGRESGEDGVYYDEETGAWKDPYNAYIPPEYIDIGAEIDTFLSEAKPNQFVMGDVWKDGKGDFYQGLPETVNGIYLVDRTTKKLDDKELYQMARGYILGNDQMMQRVQYEMSLDDRSLSDLKAQGYDQATMKTNLTKYLGFAQEQIDKLGPKEIANLFKQSSYLHDKIEPSVLKHGFEETNIDNFGLTEHGIWLKAAANKAGTKENANSYFRALVKGNLGKHDLNDVPINSTDYGASVETFKNAELSHAATVVNIQKQIDEAIPELSQYIAGSPEYVDVENKLKVLAQQRDKARAQESVAKTKQSIISYFYNEAARQEGVDTDDFNTILNVLEATKITGTTEFQKLVEANADSAYAAYDTFGELYNYYKNRDADAATKSISGGVGLGTAIPITHAKTVGAELVEKAVNDGIIGDGEGQRIAAEIDNALKTYDNDLKKYEKDLGKIDRRLAQMKDDIGHDVVYYDLMSSPNNPKELSRWAEAANRHLRGNLDYWEVIKKDGEQVMLRDYGAVEDAMQEDINNLSVVGFTSDVLNSDLGYGLVVRNTQSGETFAVKPDSESMDGLVQLALGYSKEAMRTNEEKGTVTSGWGSTEVSDFLETIAMDQVDKLTGFLKQVQPNTPTDKAVVTVPLIDGSETLVVKNFQPNGMVNYTLTHQKDDKIIETIQANNIHSVNLALEKYNGSPYEVSLDNLTPVINGMITGFNIDSEQVSVPYLDSLLIDELKTLGKKVPKDQLATLTSLTRSRLANLVAGGVPTSLHTQGKAVDISLGGGGSSIRTWLDDNSTKLSGTDYRVMNVGLGVNLRYLVHSAHDGVEHLHIEVYNPNL